MCLHEKKLYLWINLLCYFVSRYGRVNYVLARRLELLREVGRLQESLDVPGDVSYTCETAGHFYLYQVIQQSLGQASSKITNA